MKKSILYIDDEKINLRQFKYTFRRDYDVETALSGEEALEILKENKFDLIITDQIMPEMSGAEFLEAYQKEHPKTPPSRIMLSGYAPTKEIKKAKERFNLHRFVLKPCGIDELKGFIAEAIAV